MIDLQVEQRLYESHERLPGFLLPLFHSFSHEGVATTGTPAWLHVAQIEDLDYMKMPWSLLVFLTNTRNSNCQ